MDSINITEEFKSQLQGLFLGLLQDPPTAPAPLSVVQAEAQIWGFCRQILTEQELQPVEKILNHKEQLLALNLAMLKKLAEMKTANVLDKGALDEMVEAYDKHQQEMAQEAAAKTRLKPNTHEQVKQAIEQYRKNIAATSPEAAAAIEPVVEGLATQAELDPETTIKNLTALTADVAKQAGKPLSDAQNIISITPVVEAVSKVDLHIQNLAETAAATSNLPEQVAPVIGAAAVVAKFDNYSPQKTSALLEALVPPLEASSRQSITLPTAQISQIVKDFNFKASGDDLVAQTIAAQFAKVGIEKGAADQMTQTMMINNVPLIARVLADHATSPDASIEENQKNKRSAFIEANNAALAYLSKGPKARFQQMLQAAGAMNWDRVMDATESYPLQGVGGVQEFYLRRSKMGGPNALLGFLLGRGQSWATSAVTKKAAAGLAKWAAEKGLIKAAAAVAAPETAGTSLLVAQALEWAKDAGSWILRQIKENWQPIAFAIGGAGAALLAGFPGIGIGAAAAAGGAVGTSLTPGGLTKVGNWLSNGFNAIAGLAVVEIATPLLVITLCVPIVAALILFIINNSAYIVPQATGAVGLGGVGSTVSCFSFEGFDQEELQVLNQAAQTITSESCYNAGLCAKGTIRVVKIDSSRCYGGYADSGNRVIYLYRTGVRQIVRKDGACLSGDPSAANALYTLAHESGHVYARHNPAYGTLYASYGLPTSDGSCLPTYSLYNGNNATQCLIDGPGGPYQAVGEDLAETIADHFSYPEVLANFSNHQKLADAVFNSCLANGE